MARPDVQSQLADAYAQKRRDYFDGARHDFIARLPEREPARILEIGCGTGLTGELALAAGKCSVYVGVELMPEAADAARRRLTEVIVGNVEAIELPFPDAHFDALIMSEVLEHLVDPWAVLTRLNTKLKPGAIALASSPNIAHWRVIRDLLAGRFDLEDQGVMDRTHLRWFTPKTYAAMFEACGYVVDDVWPLVPMTSRQRAFATLSGGRGHLFMRQICLAAHKPA